MEVKLFHLIGWPLVEYVIFCVFFWWMFYFIVLIISRQTEEWTCRFLTLIHGAVLFSWAVKDSVLSNREFYNTPLSDEQKLYLSVMLSYFIFDYSWIRTFGKEPWLIHLHHIASILVLTKIIISDFGGTGVSCVVAGLECTNPYLQVRWFLRTYGYNNKPIFAAVEIWFFFLFFIIRVVSGTGLYFYTLSQEIGISMKIMCSCIYIVSLALAWDVSRYMIRKYWINRRNSNVLSQFMQQYSLPRIINNHSYSDNNESSSPAPLPLPTSSSQKNQEVEERN